MVHCCGRSSQPCAGTFSSSGCFFFCALCQFVPLGAWREDTPSGARLTMSFLLPSSICLAVAFHSGSLSSYLLLILLMRSPTNPFQIPLPVWNLGGNMRSGICSIFVTYPFPRVYVVVRKIPGPGFTQTLVHFTWWTHFLFLSPQLSHLYNGTDNKETLS